MPRSLSRRPPGADDPGLEAHQSSPRRHSGTCRSRSRDRRSVADGHILASGPTQKLTDDLVAHGEGQLDAAVGDVDALAAAEVEEALPDVEVAVADARP